MRAETGLALALALALGGCHRGSPQPQPQSTAAARAAPAASVNPAAAAERVDEVQADELFGTWRVVGVAPDTGSAFARDDPRIMGALMDLYAEKLGWSYLPQRSFSPNDVCLGPVSGLATQSADAAAIRSDLASALATVRHGDGRLSRPHHWMCGDGGEWGGEAAFQVIGGDDMAMRWPGGITLMLHRIQRASKDPPDLPPTGAYEGPADGR